MTVAVLGMAVIVFNPILLSAIGLEVLLLPACMLAMLALACPGAPCCSVWSWGFPLSPGWT